MMRKSGTGLRAALLALATAAVLAACGSSSSTTSTKSSTTAASGPGAGKPAVVIGDKNFPEENILGALYATALKAKGYKVTLKDNIGSSEITYKALTSGQIGMYPEYTGTVLSVLAGDTANPPSAAAAFTQAKAFLANHGLTLLPMTPFADSDVVVTLAAYAKAHGLKSVADLKKLGKSVKLAALPEFATRFAGLVGLKKDYSVVPSFVPLATSALVYQALDSGQAQAIDAFTTDPQLKSGKYALLTDPKGVFGYENAAPIVSNKVIAAEGPEFASTLNAVSALLTLPAIQQMNAAVILDKQSPATVAEAFLKANHLA
ncbi:MAG TPA: glycine betaine ABC transporter substrate-binding protein [Solirubrobacteraceae bacterium]|nr:glycine betaine ABC transporter substrate-binding protein [Solirubrobacteraceae bacterium]